MPRCLKSCTRSSVFTRAPEQCAMTLPATPRPQCCRICDILRCSVLKQNIQYSWRGLTRSLSNFSGRQSVSDLVAQLALFDSQCTLEMLSSVFCHSLLALFLLPSADRVLPKPITSQSKPPFGLLEEVSRLHYTDQ